VCIGGGACITAGRRHASRGDTVTHHCRAAGPLQASFGPLKGATVPVFAVSEFLRTVFIILVATPFILLWGAALLDLVRGHQHHGVAIVAWMLVILIIPIIGPMIYFAFRKPSQSQIDHDYLAGRELERDRTAQRVGGVGIVP
jgi:hypothetical protein